MDMTIHDVVNIEIGDIQECERGDYSTWYREITIIDSKHQVHSITMWAHDTDSHIKVQL